MRAIIVDDERIARRELRRLLAAHPEIEIIAEAACGNDALAVIQKEEPDLIFTDIEMPEMTGFDLLSRLAEVPEVIFTTAYDQHALKAFEVNALDYLLKPIVPARLAAALQKVRGRQAPLPDRSSCATTNGAGFCALPKSRFWSRRELHTRILPE